MISTCPRCEKLVAIPSGVDPTASVRCPLCAGEYALSEAIASAPPELIPVVVVSEQSATAVSEAVAEPAGEEQAQTRHEPEHEPEGENEAAAAVKEFSEISGVPQRRRRKPKSALQTWIEIITGGLAGLLVGYYGLAFYYGPEFKNMGLPQFPLPGIAWITAPRAGGDSTKPTEPKPVETKPAEKKSDKGKSSEAKPRSRRQDAPGPISFSQWDVC
jgi:hypothetical protein